MNEKQIIRIIKETKEIIAKTPTSDEKYLTILLNSLLSLVVLPTEELKRKPCEKVFGQKCETFYEKIGAIPTIFKPIKECKNGMIKVCNRTPQKFVEKLRNGIAHQCIEIKEFEEITYVTIYNIFRKNKYITRDFEIKLSFIELKKLALYIANCFLNIGKQKH